jgi:hypothetical protein
MPDDAARRPSAPTPRALDWLNFFLVLFFFMPETRRERPEPDLGARSSSR